MLGRITLLEACWKHCFLRLKKVSIVLTLTEFNGGLAQKIEEYCACHVRKCLGATVSLTKDCIAYF